MRAGVLGRGHEGSGSLGGGGVNRENIGPRGASFGGKDVFGVLFLVF